MQWQKRATAVDKAIKKLASQHVDRLQVYDDVFKNKNRLKNVRSVIGQTSKLRQSINAAAFGLL